MVFGQVHFYTHLLVVLALCFIVLMVLCYFIIRIYGLIQSNVSLILSFYLSGLFYMLLLCLLIVFNLLF